MFAGGCGRLFEGTPSLMFEALHEKLGSLPAETRVYCGHEYTESNLQFASEIFPDNLEIAERLAMVQEIRKRAAENWHDAKSAEMTIPTTIGQEYKTNPFLLAPTVEELARIRALKDEW
jgi:hydroxyacylglutathione hydrolase